MIDLALHLINLVAAAVGLRKAIQPAPPPAPVAPAPPTGQSGPVASGGGAVAVGGSVQDERAQAGATFHFGAGVQIETLAGGNIAHVEDRRGPSGA